MGGQRLIVASIALAGLACRERGAATPDAATDGSKSEGSSALTLVIAVTGCARYEPAGDCGPDGGTAPCCTGRAAARALVRARRFARADPFPVDIR